MAESWYLLKSGHGAPAENMAVDEALLEFASALGRPVLRFYAWTEPAATFGYSQHYAEVATWTRLRPLIRRPTGGGLVPHDSDWTYSLVFPPNHLWFAIKATESYRQVHAWLHRAFERLGVPTHLAPTSEKPAPGRCFIGAEKFDLVQGGVKLAGAAQRRNRLGLLIQGSVQPREHAPLRADWEKALCECGPWSEPVKWELFVPDAAFSRRVDQLTQARYSQARHNERR